MEKHDPDSPGGDRNSNKHYSVSRSSIPPIYGAPDELPDILKDDCPPTESIETVRKKCFRNAGQDNKDNSIAVSQKESVVDIRRYREIEVDLNVERKNNMDTKTQQELSETSNIKSVLDYKEIKCQNNIDLPHGINLLHDLLSKMADKVNRIIDLTVKNEPTKFQGRKTNFEQEKINSQNEKDSVLNTDTKSLIQIPNRCNSENCGNFNNSQLDKNTKILKEMIHLVTATISQLKVITEGQIITNHTKDSSTLFIRTSAGPATATVLSKDFFMKPVQVTSETVHNTSDSSLDIDFMYHKIHKAEAIDVFRNSSGTMDENYPSQSSNISSFSISDQECENNVKCRSNPHSNHTSIDNSVLLGSTAAGDEDKSTSSPSLINASIKIHSNQLLTSPPSITIFQMFQKGSTPSNSQSRTNFLRTSNRPPVEIVNHGEGVLEIARKTLENHLYTSNQYNSFNYEVRTHPATKESENKTITQLQKFPQNFHQAQSNRTSDGSLKVDTTSYSSNASSSSLINHQLQLCLMHEKPPTDKLGSDSAPILLNTKSNIKDSLGYVEELKKCVFDPNKYLERCMALSTAKELNETKNVHKTIENISRESLQIINKKNDKKKQISSKINMGTNDKLKLVLSHPVSGGYKNINKTAQSSENNEYAYQVEKSISKLFNENSDISIANKEFNKSLISKNSSKEVNVKHSSRLSLKKDNNQTIQGGVSKIVISTSKTKTNIKSNSKSSKNNLVQQQKSNKSRTLIVVTENKNSEIVNKYSENYYDDHSKTNIPNTQEEITHWLNKYQEINKETKLETKQHKRRKLATYNTRKGRICHGTKSHSMSLVLKTMKVLLQPSSIGLVKGFSDSVTNPPTKQLGIMSQTFLDILMDTIKEGFLRGISSVSDTNDLVKIQKALSAPNPDIMVNRLLDKLKAADPFLESEKNISNENMINGESILTQKSSGNYVMSSGTLSSVEKINPPTNIYSNEDAFSRQSSTLANYLGNETSSENLECNKNITAEKKDLSIIGKNTKKPNDHCLSSITQPSLKQLYSVDLQSCASSKEGIDFDETPVFDITPDPPTAVSIERSQEEIPQPSLKSGNISKPPPHPGRPHKTQMAIIQKTQTKTDLPNRPTTKSSIVDQMCFQSSKDFKMNNIVKYQQNCMTDPVHESVKLTQFCRQLLLKEKGFTACQEGRNTYITEGIPHSSKNKINENSLQWMRYSSQPIRNYPISMNNNDSEKIYKKKKASPNMQYKSGFMGKTTETFLKSYRYSQRNISLKCNGRCIYHNPRVYAHPCPSCQRMKAENVSMDYMGSIFGNVVQTFVNKATNRSLKNAFNNTVQRRNATQSLDFSKKKTNIIPLREKIPIHGPKAQYSKSSSSPLISNQKLKKARPATSIPTSKKNDMTSVT
ncbi:hypothetical protein L9F63_019934 [Diploptera punctata]|uniref:Uncharacterized protein n=1 Tax=Diploptera punctata TaxID=6984 RepID=A0AAD7ZT82_DIPPU|nr:hypothetical protein L9F63_019934 [Diploptera punctata]